MLYLKFEIDSPNLFRIMHKVPSEKLELSLSVLWLGDRFSHQGIISGKQ